MELNENELNNVVGGANPIASEEIANANEDLFRGKSVEELKRMRDEMLSEQQEITSGELTQEELDNVQAGRSHRF